MPTQFRAQEALSVPVSDQQSPCVGHQRRASRQALRCRSQQSGKPVPPTPAGQSVSSQSPVTPSGPQTPSNKQSGFGNVEKMIASNFNNVQPGLRDDWTEVQGNWVLRPPNRRATAVVHFLGGAFVGAAPQLTYRLFLEAMAAKGIMVGWIYYTLKSLPSDPCLYVNPCLNTWSTLSSLVFPYEMVELASIDTHTPLPQIIATPFSTNFDHLRIADEIHYKWDQCIHNPSIAMEIRDLPVYGVGHSMGCLQHLLISARYASTSRAGNVLMSFNNKPATDAIPFFTPFIAPGARALGPFLAQVH